MKVLVFCDDLYHPGAIARAGLAPLSAAGFTFDWVENATHWDPSGLTGYRVALLTKSNVRGHGDKTRWLSGAAESVFLDYVRSGGGLVVIHSGAAGYADAPAVRTVTGGTFLNHPPPCAVVIEPEAGHPLTEGVTESFVVHDEHYQVALDDAEADVFLHTRSAHGVQPAGWTRVDGKGRVSVLTPGHFPEVWLHPSFQQLLRNSLCWVADSL